MTFPRIKSLFAIGLLLSAGGLSLSAAAAELKTLSVSPAEFRPASRVDGDLAWVATNGEFYYTNVDFNNRYDRENYAPLFLPHGARIKSLTVHYTDLGCSIIQDIRVALLRQNMASGAVRKLAEVSSQGLPIDPSRNVLETDAIADAVVNNNLFSYTLLVRFNNIKRDRVRFHGATIHYE
ncbi:MAG: hypothetical protein JW742_02320 [Candidatus Aminicenantes bacterium]|nr:hypothetical protein [Candidatus Aminicenantes bacterium]